MHVTDAALALVREALDAPGDGTSSSSGLRVAVSGTRGAQYTYDVSVADIGGEEDVLRYDQDGVTIMVPLDSVVALHGATLDVIGALDARGLVVRNPNRPGRRDPVGWSPSGTVRERVEQVLEEIVNPQLALHDGHASLVGLTDGDTRVVVTMDGRCQGCAVSPVTLGASIRRSILELVPEVVEVVDATDHSAGASPYYR